jgi:hypothetical protein
MRTALLHRRNIGFIIVAILLASLLLNGPASASLQPSVHPLPGCTTFYGYDGENAFAGNNEDFTNPLMYAWFIPATPNRFGRVYFGFEDFIPQGGVNDQGVFFDGESLPYKEVPLTSQRQHFPGGDLALLDEILSRSANLQDVIDIASRWNRAGAEYGQSLFGDRFGDSAILDGDTILRKAGNFQIATNFRLVDNPTPPWPDGEERYGVVLNMLSGADHYSVDMFRLALDLAHAEGFAPTIYSQVYELNTGIIHLYLYHDFEHEVIINLADELAKGPHVVELRSLFPDNHSMDQWASEQINNWKASYEDLIDQSILPVSQDWMSGQYDVVQEADTGPVKIYLENDQLYMQRPNQLAIQLYPASADSVFHRFLNGFDLTFTFHRDLNGQATGALGTFSYAPYNISMPYDLTQTGTQSYGVGLWIIDFGVVILLGLIISLLFLYRRKKF